MNLPGNGLVSPPDRAREIGLLLAVSPVIPSNKMNRLCLNNSRFAEMIVAVLLCGLSSTASAQTNYQRLLSFGSPLTTGSNLVTRLIQGGDGALYGTALAGGSGNGGTVFKLNSSGGAFTVLHSFSDAASPYGRLLEGNEGALYGTTEYAGSNRFGMVFKLNKDGSGFRVLHDFQTNNVDGGHPFAGLIQIQGGKLYGTTFDGGSSNYGTIFMLNTDGSGYTNLHNFTGFENNGDASNPHAELIQGTDGLLYGTTEFGGANDMGTVFRLNTNGGGFSIIYQFDSSDGNTPIGSLIEGGDGLLYGTTLFGGAASGGTIFRMSKDGSNFSVIYHFSGITGGIYPFANLVQGADNALYGTTWQGGKDSLGTVFKINTNGSNYLTLHDFQSTQADGEYPQAALLWGNDGALYGSTASGGDSGGGTVFKLFSSLPNIAITSIQKNGAGTILDVSGCAAGQAYQIQATTNLINTNGWQVIGTNVARIDGTFQFLDIGATNFPIRFYRTFFETL